MTIKRNYSTFQTDSNSKGTTTQQLIKKVKLNKSNEASIKVFCRLRPSLTENNEGNF